MSKISEAKRRERELERVARKSERKPLNLTRAVRVGLKMQAAPRNKMLPGPEKNK